MSRFTSLPPIDELPTDDIPPNAEIDSDPRSLNLRSLVAEHITIQARLIDAVKTRDRLKSQRLDHEATEADDAERAAAARAGTTLTLKRSAVEQLAADRKASIVEATAVAAALDAVETDIVTAFNRLSHTTDRPDRKARDQATAKYRKAATAMFNIRLELLNAARFGAYVQAAAQALPGRPVQWPARAEVVDPGAELPPSRSDGLHLRPMVQSALDKLIANDIDTLAKIGDTQ